MERLEGGEIGIDHHLGHAVVVAQVDEQHAAMVAVAMAQPERRTVSPASARLKAPQVWVR